MNKYNLNNSYKAVVIGGSAGSFQGVVKILAQLPKGFPLPIIMCLHRLKHVRNGFVEALSIKSIAQVTEPNDKENIKKGGVYLAPANYHMSIELGHYFALSTEEMINNSRPAIDITLGTSAFVFKEKLIGILLSGANRDGALGMKHIKDKGGITIVQEPSECMIDTMPKAAQAVTKIDHVMRIDQIIDFFKELDKQYR
jgi:two-component system, chemotaxis family, protein-glutamate methylesterase/glutaminase